MQVLNQINILYIVAIIVVVALILLFIGVRRANNKKNKQVDLVALPFDIEEFIEALGSINNIVDVTGTISKVTFKLDDNSKVDFNKISEYGASGTVETSSGVTFIFGNISKSIETLVKEKL